jgi:hypothetical protein
MYCHPYGPCSYYSNLYHSSNNCLSYGQVCNFSYEQMNINVSSLGFESNLNFYNLDWSNHTDFSWQAQVMRNCAPQFHELHHTEYPQFETQVLHPSPYDHFPQQSSLEDTLKEFMERTGQSTIQVPQPESSLEDTLKAFMHLIGQSISDVKNATMANTPAIESLEGQLDRLVAKLNKMEGEELQSQLMAERHYMIDEDDSSNPHHEHVQAITIHGSEKVVDEIVNEPSLEDPLEECFAQFKFDLDLYRIPVQSEALLDSTPKIRPKHGETIEISFSNTTSSAAEEEKKEEHLKSVEHLEQIKPPSTPNLFNDKDVSIEAHSFITISLETLYEPLASVLQCLKEPPYDKLVKGLCTQGHKSRNHLPKKIIGSKQVGYLRWRNILLKGYQILNKKGWKRLVGHPNDRGKHYKISFPLYFPHIFFLSFFILFLVILFLTATNLLMFVLMRQYCC